MTRVKVRGLSGGIGLVIFAVSAQAWAFGLGNIHVRSYLGQPFLATISIRIDSPSDLAGLNVSLGSPAQFSNAGIEASAADYSLHFKVEGGGSQPFVKVTSRRPIRVPFLNFIVQVQWGGGTLLRQYTILVNPLEYGSQGKSIQSAPMPAAAIIPASGQVSVTTNGVSTAREAVAPSPPPASGIQKGAVAENRNKIPVTLSTKSSLVSTRIPDGSLYGPVKTGEPFWSIASRARPPGKSISMDQVLLAIYEANPRAFANGNFNKLMRGRMLHIPSTQTMRRVGKKSAHRRILALMNGATGSAVAAGSTSKITKGPSSGSSGGTAGQPVVSTGSKSAVSAGNRWNATVSKSAATVPNSKGTAGSGAVVATATPGSSVVQKVRSAEAATSGGSSVAASEPGAVNPPVNLAAIASAVLGAPTGLAGANPVPVTKSANANKELPPKAADKLSGDAQHSQDGWMAWARQWRELAIGLLVVFVLLALLIRRRQAAAVRTSRERQEPLLAESAGHAEDAGAEQERHGLGVFGSTGIDEGEETEAKTEFAPQTDDFTPEHPSETQSSPADHFTGGSSASTSEQAVEDPIGDADFHIEYGLYDEAIRILNTSLEANPDRLDVKVKLADCYAAQGNSTDFRRIATELYGSVSEAEWLRIAETGRRLCPEVALFQSSGHSDDEVADRETPATESEMSVHSRSDKIDLSGFDEQRKDSLPDNEMASFIDLEGDDLTTDDRIAPSDASGSGDRKEEVTSPFDADHLIDFGDEHIPEDTAEESIRDDLPQREVADDQTDDKVPAVAVESDAWEGVSLGNDLETPRISIPTTASADDSDAGLSLDESSEAVSGATGTESSETTYKLDLARAYADMGDNDAARELIEEVLHLGDKEQQGQARKLLEELAE